MEQRPGPTLAEVSEEEVLAAILPSFVATERELVGPGDDAAVLDLRPGPVVATTDAMVRGQDWLDEWSSPADVAVKCLTQNLADVAAMGAVPTSLLVTLAADRATPVRWLADFAAELGTRAEAAGVGVVGGDLSSAPQGTLVVSVTALGDLQGRDAVCRDGASPGDLVAVRGSLGRSAAGYRLLRRGALPGEPGTTAYPELLAAHLRPVAPIAEGVVAARAGATAMIDLSDGLLRDADRVGRASGVLVDLAESALAPFVAALEPAVGEDEARECVLAGGEEHSLLATFPSADAVPAGWAVLGAVREGRGVALDGVLTAPRGWDHFAG